MPPTARFPKGGGPSCTSASRTGSSAWPPAASASTRRSSATTSSAPTAVAWSSARPTHELRWLGARASQRLEQAGRRALARGDLPAAIGLLERAASASTDDMSQARGAAAGDRRRADRGRQAPGSRLGARRGEAGRGPDGGRAGAFARARAAAVPRAAARERGRERGGRAGRGAGASRSSRPTTTSTASAAPGGSRPGCTGTRRTPGRRPRPGSRLPRTPAGLPTRARAPRSSPGSPRRCGSARRRWPRPSGAARRSAREVGGHLDAEALTLRHLAGLHAMNGNFELARSMLATSNGVFEELGLTLNAATSQNEALIEMLAGDYAAAEASLRSGFDALTEMGEQAFLSTTAAFLARAVFEQDAHGRGGGARAAERTPGGDRRSAHAGALARRPGQSPGERAGSSRTRRRSRARPSRSRSRPTSSSTAATPSSTSRTSSRDSGLTNDAAAAAAAGLQLHEQKGNLVTAAKIRSELAMLL